MEKYQGGSTGLGEDCDKINNEHCFINSLEDACKGYDYIRMTWADMHGIARCKTAPVRHIRASLKDGVGVWNGVNAISPRNMFSTELIDKAGIGKMEVKPVYEGKVYSIPWACGGDPSYKVGQILCESYWYSTNRTHATCTRSLARQQLDRLQDLTGLSLYSTFEAEFMVYERQTRKRLGDSHGALCLGAELAQYEKMLYDMERQLYIGGVDIEGIHNEAAAGQYEFNIHPQYGIGAADQMFLCKQYTKEIAVQQNLTATFMAKLDDGLGNGLHFNFSLWKDKKNVLYNPQSPNDLSEIGKHWLAGLLKHMPALTTLCNPTINCYRRLGTFATPSQANWQYNDRLGCVRVRTEGPSTTLFENRLASGCANPYLVLAGTVAAGLDGLINKLPCPPPMAPEALKLPSSLPEAIQVLKDDLILTEALGQEFLTWWTMTKNSHEIKNIQSIEDDEKRLEREMEEYMEVL